MKNAFGIDTLSICLLLATTTEVVSAQWSLACWARGRLCTKSQSARFAFLNTSPSLPFQRRLCFFAESEGVALVGSCQNRHVP